MDKVIKLFKQIQEASGLNDKKAIITANKDNELFKNCLRFLLDGNIVTGISSKKIKKHIEPSLEMAPYYLGEFCDFGYIMSYFRKITQGEMRIFMKYSYFYLDMKMTGNFMNK